MRRWLIGSVLAVLALGMGFIWLVRPRRGSLAEEHSLTVGGNTIRERLYGETNTIVPGSYFVIDARDGGSGAWRPVLTFRHDAAPWEHPEFAMHTVGDSVAYLYVGWVYAVTTDGGREWKVWDASEDLPRWECCNYHLIDRLELGSDGLGRMYLDLIENPQRITPVLRTHNFGSTWEWADTGEARSLR